MQPGKSIANLVDHVYAELLINVRIVTIFVHVTPEAVKDEIKISLIEDGTHAQLKCRDVAMSLRLPAKVINGHPTLRLIPSQGQERSIRLPLDSAWSLPAETDGELSPWSAADLRDFECAHCRVCRSDVIKPGTIDVWKDLPSENWAEMMDFWHCHKPEEPSSANDAAEAQDNKGYSASNKLSAQAGTGFVDASHLLVAEADCSNIMTVGAYLRCDAFNHGQSEGDSL